MDSKNLSGIGFPRYTLSRNGDVKSVITGKTLKRMGKEEKVTLSHDGLKRWFTTQELLNSYFPETLMAKIERWLQGCISNLMRKINDKKK